MSSTNGTPRPAPSLGSAKRLDADGEVRRVARLCSTLHIPEPVLHHGGFTAVWPEFDVALVVETPSRKKTRLAVNRAAAQSYFVVLASEEEWQSGAALDAVVRVVRA